MPAGDKPPPYVNAYAHDATRSRYVNRAESLRIAGGYLAVVKAAPEIVVES